MEKIPPLHILNKTIKVTILNKDGKNLTEFQMRGGMNLWVFIRKHGLPIGSSCSGVGVCAACCVKVIDTDESCVSAQSDFEKETLKRNNLPTTCRLACLCRVYADIQVQADYW